MSGAPFHPADSAADGPGNQGRRSAAPRAADDLSALVRDGITRPLARLRRRWRLYAAAAGAVRLALVIILLSLLQLLFDRWLKLSIDQRFVLNVTLTLIWLWFVYRRLVSVLVAPLSNRDLAMVIDRAQPALHDRIASAVEFARDASHDPRSRSPALTRAVIEEACRDARRVPILAVLNHKRAAQRGVELTAQFALVGLAFIIMPEVMSTWFQRNWMLRDIPWPQRTILNPLGFDPNGRQRLPRGDELEIVAGIVGEAPSSADLIWWTTTGRRGREPMTRIGDARVEASLGLLTEDIHFRLVGGDERTREFVVEAVDRPRVLKTVVRVTPPQYTGLEPREIERQTYLDVLQGSDLRIDAWTNKPVVEATLAAASGESNACELLDAQHLRVRLSDPAGGAYTFQLLDADQLSDRNPVRLTIKVVPDRPPKVRMTLVGVGEFITPQAELAVELEVRDAFGLASVELATRRNQDDPVQRAVDGFEPPSREFSPSLRFAAAAAQVTAGDRLRIWTTATDIDPRGPNTAASPTVELRVLSRDDFLTEMARREYVLRQEFERLISSQRVIKDALLRVLPELSPGGAVEARLAQRLSSISRRQSFLARRCLVIRERFRKILAEMWTSKVAGAAVDRRITSGIVEPLGELGGEYIEASARSIAELRDDAAFDRRDAVVFEQDEIIRRMRVVLAEMLKWEGYREAVALLREIMAEQGAVRSATLDELNKQLADILDLDDPLEDSPPKTPKP